MTREMRELAAALRGGATGGGDYGGGDFSGVGDSDVSIVSCDDGRAVEGV